MKRQVGCIISTKYEKVEKIEQAETKFIKVLTISNNKNLLICTFRCALSVLDVEASYDKCGRDDCDESEIGSLGSDGNCESFLV